MSRHRPPGKPSLQSSVPGRRGQLDPAVRIGEISGRLLIASSGADVEKT
jgi:hypothetical protein